MLSVNCCSLRFRRVDTSVRPCNDVSVISTAQEMSLNVAVKGNSHCVSGHQQRFSGVISKKVWVKLNLGSRFYHQSVVLYS